LAQRRLKPVAEPIAHTMKNAWKSLGIDGALLILLTMLVYLPTMRGGFIWDDDKLIVRNRTVKASDGLYQFWFKAAEQDYRPVAWSFWWIEWRLWGAKATGYHVVNVLLHGIDAVLVWLVLRRLKIPGAWLASLVFAIHPVNVATVAWISEQKNTLSMFFFALAILLYLKFDEENHWGWYGLSLTMGLLALLTKTAVVMLPVVLLGCAWWQHGRLRLKDWLCSIPLFIASLVLSLVTIIQHRHVLEGVVVQPGGFGTRLALAGWVPWFYLSEALLPVNLTVIYPKWTVDASNWISYVPGTILIGSLVVFWWNRRSWGRPLFFGLGYFVVMLFPVLGFFDQAYNRYSWVADHWQYYSIVGVIALVVAAAERLGHRMRGPSRSIATLAGTAVLTVLGLASWERGVLYADSETLWRDNVARSPGPWQCNNLAFALEQKGKRLEAIEMWQRAIQLDPDYAEAHTNLGIALKQLGRMPEAIEQYKEALRARPDLVAAHYALGMALWLTGKPQEAIDQYEQAVKIQPDFPEGHDNLGIVLAQVGRTKDAIQQYEEALQVRPDYADAQNNLARLLATLPAANGGDPARAVTLAERACESTGHGVANYLDTLAAAYAAAGRFNDAIVTAQNAIALARSTGQLQIASEFETRLKLYRSGHAYVVAR